MNSWMMSLWSRPFLVTRLIKIIDRLLNWLSNWQNLRKWITIRSKWRIWIKVWFPTNQSQWTQLTTLTVGWINYLVGKILRAFGLKEVRPNLSWKKKSPQSKLILWTLMLLSSQIASRRSQREVVAVVSGNSLPRSRARRLRGLQKGQRRQSRQLHIGLEERHQKDTT